MKIKYPPLGPGKRPLKPGSKHEVVATMVSRPGGCTWEEAAVACGWVKKQINMPFHEKRFGVVFTRSKKGNLTNYEWPSAKPVHPAPKPLQFIVTIQPVL